MAQNELQVYGAIEHKLASPQVKVNFALEFDAFESTAGARKFGIGLEFGS